MSTRALTPAVAAPNATVTPLQSPLLQRACDCGQHTGGGECDDCKKKKTLLQRQAVGPAGPAVAPPAVLDVLRSPGQPLDDQTREFFESRLGGDFSQVRVHTDSRAEESARAVNARAYTVERHVVFDTNEYSPTTPEGRRLLAHELTHVMQQRKQSAAGSGIAVHNDVGSEREAARSEEKAGSGNDLITASQDTANPASLGLQRQAAKAGSPGTTTTKSSSAPASSSCLEAIEGEDVSSLLEAGAVTIIEFGAYWCNPCHMLEAGLQEICQKYKTNPPGVPVRFYTIDITLEGNKKLGDRYAPDGGVPHLYIYVGSSQKHHSDFALEPDVLSVVVDEQVEYATTSGAKRGAKSGMKWGGLAGGLAGLGGAIAILSGAGGLSGNTLMLAALGSLVGGAAVGIGLGAGIGAIAGALTDDRKRGPRTQQRHHLDATGISPKLRSGQVDDPREREADEMADRVLSQDPVVGPLPTGKSARSATVPGLGEPLDPPARRFMESRFNQDFSRVTVHRDAAAAQITNRRQALAVTSGSEIHFAADGYAPNSISGRAILAHELAHVVQNRNTPPSAAIPSLEAEAEQASARAIAGRSVEIRHGSPHAELAMTRAQHTALWTAIGTVAVGAAGALAGLGITALTHSDLGQGALIGGIAGGAAGLIGGFFYGLFKRRSEPVGTKEADALIRRRFGNYLQGGKGPLHDAVIHPVSQAELCMKFRCRHPQNPQDCSTLVGLTDTGPEPPNQIASAQDEPICDNGQQLEHATPDHPVIYYATDHRDAAILVHEGLHAYAHPNFGSRLRNYVNEGATEYFTRQILDDINMPSESGYGDEVAAVEQLVSIVGQESLRRAFFLGEMEQLDAAVAKVLGPCALEEWAFDLQMSSFRKAQAVIDGRGKNYCPKTSSAAPAEGSTILGARPS
ncbi:MAG: DUF4157 domain-containing protein [Terriglobales bacterium]